MLTEIETARRADFRACPILEDYIATMLEDLQFCEMEEACMEEREQRDNGTVYTLSDAEYAKARELCTSFYAANLADIEAAGELVPGQDGLRYGREYMTPARIGYYLYMTRVGHGVAITDDAAPGEADCIARLDAAIQATGRMEAMMGEEGEVYTMRG